MRDRLNLKAKKSVTAGNTPTISFIMAHKFLFDFRVPRSQFRKNDEIFVLCFQFKCPLSASKVVVQPGKFLGGSPALQFGQGIPAPPQQGGCPSFQGTSEWFSQTQNCSLQFLHVGLSLIPAPHVVGGVREAYPAMP